MENYEGSLDIGVVEGFNDDLNATAGYLRDKFGEEYSAITMDIILQKLDQGELD